MKKFFRQLVLDFLIRQARKRISPKSKIIGITGSVGKTTAKDATAKILSTKFVTLATKGNFNSEFGVPLTLLEEESGGSDFGKWLGILFRARKKGKTKIDAEQIVLELGVDAPGDFKKLMEIVTPNVGVLLNVAPVHLEKFQTIDAIAAEKEQLISNLPEDGIAILNADDRISRAVPFLGKKILFGLSEEADLRATEIKENFEGLSARISLEGESAELNVPILGEHNLSSLLAAIIVGVASGVPLQDAVAALNDFQMAPGRLNLLAGMKHSIIIDGSYNSNPTSLAAALETFHQAENPGRKIAVLGQMNELGPDSEKFHRELGKKAAEVADVVVGVYGDAGFFVDEMKNVGKKAEFFLTAEAAGDWLEKELHTANLVLFKGSQNNVWLERAIAKILQNPEDQKLLCRQKPI